MAGGWVDDAAAGAAPSSARSACCPSSSSMMWRLRFRSAPRSGRWSVDRRDHASDATGTCCDRALASDGDLVVGAGTVLTAAQAEACGRCRRVVHRFTGGQREGRHVVPDAGMPVFPGVATPTDIQAALELGIDVVKFFPADVFGGVSAIKALAAPFTGVQFVPTGGVTAANLPAYLGHPAVLAVGGSWMVARGAIASQDWDGIASLVAAAVAIAADDNRWPDGQGWRSWLTSSFRNAQDCRYDAIALGEVMLRLDPGEGRIRTARSFRVWEGGGEYNVARGLRRCFGQRTAVVTAFADNDVGPSGRRLHHAGRRRHRLHQLACRTTASGRDGRATALTSPNAASASAARSASPIAATPPPASSSPAISTGTTSSAQLGVRWFHTGGIFAALVRHDPGGRSKRRSRRPSKHGTIVSYDLNYRPILWKSHRRQEARTGGQPRASPSTSTS